MICGGGTVLLNATGGIEYEWMGPNGFTSNVQNPSIDNFGTINEGTYTVTVTSAEGCVTVESIDIEIDAQVDVMYPEEETVCVGDDLTSVSYTHLTLPTILLV